ncbi:urease accessory protein UreF [Nisaea acidiphila]|uniref:Urease accessory protein UreF n=1 Tax=Nisaea acidiphila TaxID=1862145 RepID=A0A9J7ASN0_9PROT|nr:urease accessory protein UreF [Nisaea acidiphila]UUX50675.1 urease accessory protein UreF [Nisaea acidiphila]
MTTTMTTVTAIPIIMAECGGIRAALRLQSWLSPSFPVGAYSYSHGIEAAIEADLVRDAATLEDWIGGLLQFGTGRNDAILLSAAWRHAAERDAAGLAELSQLALALIPTAELRLEATSQGAAFLKTVCAAWPEFEALALPPAPPLAVAYGAVTAASGIGLELAGPLFLQAFVHNLVSAAVRAVPLGQTDGQKVIAALESGVETVWRDSRGLGVEDIGSAALMAEWSSLQHEAMDGRLFRS